MRFLRFFVLLLLCILTEKAIAQEVSATQDSIKISIITCYPGPQVYELYGHTAIRVQQGMHDVAFNYGMFSFNEPNFMYRFVKGEANYVLGYVDFKMFLHEYAARKSKVVEQTLNISQEMSGEMLDKLLTNALPENRSYRYNYIYDNCSTRPRDIIESVVGASIQYSAPRDTTLSFRDIMRSYNRNYPWQSFGIDLALGSGIDKIISPKEQMFAPIYMEEALENATYTLPDGNKIKLISKTETINPGSDSGSIEAPTAWYATPVAIGALLCAIVIIISCLGIYKKRLFKGVDTFIYIIYGAGGCIIFFLIFISSHAATSPNLVGLWLNPFYFIPAILIWIKSAGRFLYFYQMINFAVLIFTIAAWWSFKQVGNIAFFPLILIPLLRQLNYIIVTRQCLKRDK